MRRWEGGKVGSGEVWKWGNVEVWKCENVEMGEWGSREIALSDFVIQDFKVVLQCMEDVYNPYFLRILNYAKDDKIVAHRISAVAHATEDWITTEFMRRRENLKVCIALFNPVCKPCRRLLIFKFVGDVLEGIEQVGVGRR